MRASLWIIASAGLLLLLGLIFVGKQPTPGGPSGKTSAAADSPSAGTGQDHVPANTSAPALPDSKPSPGEQTARDEEAYVQARVEQLADLASNDDAASLENILSDLTSRNPEIQQAAIDAAVQFGSRDAIPKLLDAATQTDDPQTKAALVEAAEFLKLPSLTEVAQIPVPGTPPQKRPSRKSAPTAPPFKR